jgi:hypothetical protein
VPITEPNGFGWNEVLQLLKLILHFVNTHTSDAIKVTSDTLMNEQNGDSNIIGIVNNLTNSLMKKENINFKEIRRKVTHKAYN